MASDYSMTIRGVGTGPAAYRVGRHLRYEPTAVQAWLQEHAS